MQVSQLKAVVGTEILNAGAPKEKIKQTIERFCDRYSGKQNTLQKEVDQIGRIILSIKGTQGIQHEIVRLQILQSDIYMTMSQEYLAAKCLLDIDFSKDEHGLSFTEALDTQLKICQYLMKVDDTTNSLDTYSRLRGIKWEQLKKKLEHNEAEFLQLRFKFIEAEYLRENGRSIQAAAIYDNALRNPVLKDYPEQLEGLAEKGVVAALFSTPSDRRTTILTSLYESPYLKPSKIKIIAQKLINSALLFNQDVQSITSNIRQREKRPDIDMVVPIEYAVYEHNLMALTNIYDVVSIKTLVQLLHMNQLKIYTLLERMIKQGRLQAQIDAVQGFVTFTQNQASDKSYNDRVNQFCRSLQNFIETNKLALGLKAGDKKP